jgi:hypothetical protein
MGQKTAISWFRARREPRVQVQAREPCDFAMSLVGPWEMTNLGAVVTGCRGLVRVGPGARVGPWASL